MTSNIKPKAKESPTEPFTSAATGCLRAIARRPELEVSFAAERPGMTGGKARLPEPPRKLTAGDAAIGRGQADAIALRMACHDNAIHRKLLPGGQQARAVFEAVEQARVEAIGGRRMTGVADNLAAMLHERLHRGTVGGGRAPHGARAADGDEPAGGGRQVGRSLAPADRESRRARARSARAA